MLSPWEGMATLGLSGSLTGTIWAGDVPSCSKSPVGPAHCSPECRPGAHLLGRASGWDISVTRTAPGRCLPRPSRPGGPPAPGSPGPRPSHRSSRCACRGSSCPRGPAHILLLGGDRQTDRQIDSTGQLAVSVLQIQGQGLRGPVPRTPSPHARGLQALTRSRGETLKYLFMRARDGL